MASSDPEIKHTAAPDLTLACGTDGPVTLSSLWEAQPVVLIFVRHLG
ncbi:MAG: hypothetical protein R3C19_03400 [Planctomycetaceae bacterium]